ncbi:MAG: glycosyltransferase [Flavihumibacter sp.]
MIYIYIITVVLLWAYALLISYYNKGWKKQPAASAPHGFSPRTAISVIIPARNEENNIEHCLRSVASQDYPTALLEIIVVDDHSSDGTAEIVRAFPQANLLAMQDQPNEGNSRAPKKRALEAGIERARGTLIVTTDADCVAGKHWLQQLAWVHENTGAQMIAAPVMMMRENTWLARFETLDAISLQGITAAAAALQAHSMCNGANLAYTKTAFETVGGFEGIDQIASGDDMLLMQKIGAAYPHQIAYAKSKDAIVETRPVGSLKQFLQQRIRWASKARFYREKKLKGVLLMVYLCNFLLLLSVLAAFFSVKAIFPALLLLLLKTAVEWVFMWKVASFFDRVSLMPFFPLFQPLHILYTVAAGSFSQFGQYEWKGRQLN